MNDFHFHDPCFSVLLKFDPITFNQNQQLRDIGFVFAKLKIIFTHKTKKKTDKTIRMICIDSTDRAIQLFSPRVEMNQCSPFCNSVKFFDRRLSNKKKCKNKITMYHQR